MAKSALLVSTALSLTMIVSAQFDAIAQDGPLQGRPKRVPGHLEPCEPPAAVLAPRHPFLAPDKDKPLHEKFTLNTSRQFILASLGGFCPDATSDVHFTCKKACTVDIKTVSQIGPAYGYDLMFLFPVVDGYFGPGFKDFFELYPNIGPGDNSFAATYSMKLKAGLHTAYMLFYFDAPLYWGISETDYHVYE
jgi:hypothetical protein